MSSLLELYPNPARNILNVLVSDQIFDVQVLNMIGERFALQMSSNGKIDVSALLSGVYCLEFKTREKTVVTKFVKQ